jgi:hypothetical protein
MCALNGGSAVNRIILVLAVLVLQMPANGQDSTKPIKWYKFNKAFIQQHYAQDGSAIGTLSASEIHPAKTPHPIDCGGDDGELHIGIPEAGLGRTPVSTFAKDSDSGFGMVAEPPNVKKGTPFFTQVEGVDGSAGAFYGYFRLWNEGHDVGEIFPSNPHHVLEVHPAWGIQSTGFKYLPRPAVIFPMTGFSGYGASKFVPLFKSVPTWLRVAEDNSSVYVQLQQADNFYQLPVVVKETRPVADNNGVAALVDVYSDTAHQNLVYQNLTVIVAANSRIASQLHANWSTYLLGFFSINLEKAMVIATGHEGPSGAVQAPGALEFFAFGVPLQNAVSKSQPCVEEDD